MISMINDFFKCDGLFKNKDNKDNKDSKDNNKGFNTKESIIATICLKNLNNKMTSDIKKFQKEMASKSGNSTEKSKKN